MKTILRAANAEGIRAAAALLREGEVVGMPTETVYGLAANALNESAVRKIFQAKGRPADNPLIVHVADQQMMDALVTHVPTAARLLMDAFWPGPLTLILPRRPVVPDVVTAGLETVGIRMPAKPEALALIRRAGCPLAAPSANTSGKPSPTTAEHVLQDMQGKIPMILDAGPCDVGLESSVVDVSGEVATVLRPGGITPEMIASVLGRVEVDGHVLSPLEEGATVRSPGMKYQHYAPNARIIIYRGAPDAVRAQLARSYDAALAQGEKPAILGFSGQDYGARRMISLGDVAHPEQAAARLFAALRQMDEEGITVGYSSTVSTQGIGLAIMNRLGRAAGFCIKDV